MRTALVLLATVALMLATADAGRGTTPTLPANGRIVFVTGDGLASMNPDGSGQWGLRFTRIGHWHPSFAPDGTALVVSDATIPGVPEELFTMQPDGTGLTQLTHVPAARDPAWSPTGELIAYDDGADIYTVERDGGSPTRVTAGTLPSWSPDGRSLAFARWDADGSHIYVVDLASGSARRLTETVAGAYSYESQPAWSPHGDRIVFSGSMGGTDGLFAVAAAGGRPTPIATAVWATYPAWSPDGAHIAYLREGAVWLANADGSSAHAVTRGVAAPGPIGWQPLPTSVPGCTLTGTAANDLLVGTSGSDVVCGLGGDDSLLGLDGNDTLLGGDGNDWIAGGTGFDVLDGGAGDDVVDARDGGGDVVRPGAGYDHVLVDPQRLDAVSRSAERVVVSWNVAAWRPTTTSSEEPTNPGVLAVDGRLDDYWSSGAFAPQWLEIDLGRPTTITRVRLVAPDLPSGMQVLLLGRSDVPGASYRLLRLVDGPTAFMQAVQVQPRRPWRNVRYVRLALPSGPGASVWASWPEVEVYSARR